VGATAARPVGCSRSDGCRKKFCMSTTTSAESAGAMVTNVSSGPNVVRTVCDAAAPRERSYVLDSRE